MCGINGVISQSENVSLITWVESMHQQQRHRGKDDEGFLFFKDSQFSDNAQELTFIPDVALSLIHI